MGESRYWNTCNDTITYNQKRERLEPRINLVAPLGHIPEAIT
jgi:hypothetical protein